MNCPPVLRTLPEAVNPHFGKQLVQSCADPVICFENISDVLLFMSGSQASRDLPTISSTSLQSAEGSVRQLGAQGSH